ncbi:MAG: aldehyde dehydrogenase family protein, partial [Gemmatimonadetes bacterium]|nr:aldehyde dehydrogenase family protein [Gemmatimonadota bacterium]
MAFGELTSFVEGDVAGQHQNGTARAKPRRGVFHHVCPIDAGDAGGRGDSAIRMIAVELTAEELTGQKRGLRLRSAKGRERPRLGKLDLTGGTETGRAVAKLAGENLTPLQFELGGKAPVIVFGDVDVDDAVNGCAFA